MISYSSYKKWQGANRSKMAPVEYYNFWDGQCADEIWFTGFLISRGFIARYPNIKFAFFSSLGGVDILKMDELVYAFSRRRRRIFFTGENIHYSAFESYQKNLLDYDSIDLSMGFDHIVDDRYLRFPLWLLEMFPASATEGTIRTICETLSLQVLITNRDRFCSMVAGGGSNLLSEHLVIRKAMVDQMSSISPIDCAGRFLHNTDELQSVYNDNKAEFLKRYKFFICPENTSVEGYVTEKIFHSIGSGCIPIYYGSLNNPEPDVLNHDAIIFWNQDGDNSATIKKVEELWNNPKLYKEFFEQPRLQPHAWEVVAEYFNMLEKKLDEICRRC